MNLFTPGNNICKTLVIPPVGSIVSDVVTTVQIPADLSVVSATPSLGSYLNGVWTIPALPCGVEASLELCFGYADSNTCPTSKELSANITTTTLDTNLNNNQVDITLDYITCCDLAECTPTEELVSVECYTEGGEVLTCDGTDNAQNTLQYTPATDVVVDDITLLSSIAGADAPAMDIFEGDVRIAGSNDTVPMDNTTTANTWFFNSASLVGGTTYTFQFSNPDVVVCWANYPPQDGFVIQEGVSPAPNKYPLVGINGDFPSEIPATKYYVITYEDEGVVRVESVLNESPYTRTDITVSGIPDTWEPCVVGGISNDAGQALELGSDGLPLYIPPTPGPIVSGDVGNDLTEGSDGAPFFSHTPSSVTNNGDGTYTHNNGIGGTQDIGYALSDTSLGDKGILGLVDHEGNTISEVSLCDLGCPEDPTGSVAPDVIFTPDSCERFYGQITGASCFPGTQVIELVGNTNVNGEVVVGAGGEFWFDFEDCSAAEGSFVYSVKCGDGVMSSGTVTIELPALTATATDDAYAGPQNQSISGSVAQNDTLCDGGAATSFEIVTSPTNGNLVFNPDGTFLYTPFVNFTGVDTFVYNVVCNGVIVASQATSTLTILAADAKDDYFVGVKDTPIVGLDVSGNDSVCGPTSFTTSYQWTGTPTDTIYGGTLSGTPDNATYTPAIGFCGVDAKEYEIICTPTGGGAPVSLGTANAYFSVSCAAAVDDSEISLDVDTPFNGNVSGNDFTCTNGGATTFHLAVDDTLDGVVNIPLNECTLSTPLTDVAITSWDQATGDYVVTPTNGFVGTGCFEYFIRCTAPDGTTSDTTPATVDFEVVPAIPAAFVEVGTSNTSMFDVTFGAKLVESGTDIPLMNGDTIHITIPEVGVDVELIVGQDVTDPSGYQNDNGAISWEEIVKSSVFTTNVPTPADLLTNNFTFEFDKWDFVTQQGGAAAGLVGIDVGSDYTWNNEVTNLGLSDVDTDVMPIQYTSIEARSGGFKAGNYFPSCGHEHAEFLFIQKDNATAATIDANATVVLNSMEIGGTPVTPLPVVDSLSPTQAARRHACFPSISVIDTVTSQFEITDIGIWWADALNGETFNTKTYTDTNFDQDTDGAWSNIFGNLGGTVINPNTRKNKLMRLSIQRDFVTTPIQEVNLYIANTPGGSPFSGDLFQVTNFSSTSSAQQDQMFQAPTMPADGVYRFYREIVLTDGTVESSGEGALLFVSY